MGITQTQNIEQDLHVLLPDNPFVPPKGNVCFINNLPPELLSRIFEIGAADNDNEDEDDVLDYWDNLRHHLDVTDTDGNGKDAQDVDADMTEEHEDEAEEGEEGIEDCQDSDITESSDLSPPWPPFQIVVSLVCRHWRQVSFATPSLWTTIDVGPDARPPYLPVSTLLERSKGLPIDIHISCDPEDHDCLVQHDETDYGPPSDDDLGILCSLLVPHVHRWNTVELSVSEYHHMHVFLSAVSGSSAASQLRALELYYHDEMEESDNFGYPSISDHFVLFGGSAPCLTSLVLWGVHVDWSQPWISSASNLIDLELAYHPEDVRPTWTQLATILRGASSLQKLSLRMSGPAGDPAEWFIEPTPESPRNLNAPIELVKVTDFVLAFNSQVRSIGLLRRFYLPAVKHMILDFDSGEYTDFVHELVGPATSLSLPVSQEQPRSLLSCLESLKIAGLPCRIECVETLYGELLNLTSLNISLSFLPELFLDILGTACTLAGRSDIWLPRLTTLFVSGTSGDVIREVVEKRRELGVPLNSLYVEESCEMENGDLEWLKGNVDSFDIFEGSDDEDIIDFEDLHEEIDEWSDMD